MLRSDILKNRLARVLGMNVPYQRKENLIVNLRKQLMVALLEETIVMIKDVNTGDTKEAVTNKKLISEEKKRCLN